VLRSILTLVSGTAASQGITLVLQIFIARVYSDVDKGLFGVYGSITGFVITFAALRFDVTIILPDDDRSARVLQRLATRCVLVTSLLTSAVCVAGARILRDHYHHSGALMWWLMGAGVTVFLVSQITTLQYWLTRQGRFGDIARNRVLQSAAVPVCQLVMGLALHGGLPAIIIGTIAGQLVALLALHLRTPELREPLGDDAPSMRAMIHRYRKMPLLNGPNAVVDSVRNNGINLLIGAVSVAALGQFQLAWNIMQVPVALIAGSVALVFLKKLSDTEPGAMLPLVRAVAEGGTRGGLRPLGPGESAPKTGLLYMRADLPDLLSAHRSAAQATHFLGSFDELHVGYKDRSCLTDEDGERLICPASNGMFRPILVDRGRLVAVRPVGEGLLWKGGAAPSARVERDVNRAVSRMEQRLAG